MSREDMLVRLVAQAAGQNCDLTTLRAIVEEASEVGAARALARLGLGDDQAHEDLDELRELLGAWRAAKASAWKAAVDWTVRLVFALLLIGIAVRLNVPELLK
jgi:hypothetical protein